MRAPRLFLAFVLASLRLSAQGVTTAAIAGKVVATDGTPIRAALLTVTHTPSGARWQTTTHGTGHYSLEHLAVGGPYVVVARAIGFQPVRLEALFLSLGQRQAVDLTLIPVAIRLEQMVIRERPLPHAGAGANGPALAVPESTISRLPIRGRDVFQLALLSPHAVRTRGGGLSLAGQPDRLIGLQIDGATNNDLLGNSSLGLVGTPGQGLGVRTLSPEAVQELQVITAPFDVRFGNFAAGLVNAVTRSGTNNFEGSIGGWYSGGRLIGRDAAGERGVESNTGELALTLAGPIVRNRAAFFLDAGLQRTVLPQDVPLIGIDTALGRDSARVGIRRESVTRLQDILSQRYGVDAGTAAPFPLTGTPLNLFVKITLQPGVNSHLELSHNYSRNTPDILTFVPAFGCRERGFFCLSSNSFRVPVTVQATRLGWTSIARPGVENELRLARLHENNRCVPTTTYPGVLVGADLGFLLAGAAAFCTGSFTTEHIIEITDNLTLTEGAHRITIGGHGERTHLPSVDGLQYFFRTNWTFESLDALAAGIPSRYETTYRNPARADGPLSDLDVRQIGVYVQDQWNTTSRLTTTLGLRADVPFLDRQPTHNDALQNALGIDNSITPSGNTLWSPRLGWNYDLSGDGRTILRGGAGIFAGRPPYKWFDQVYVHTGLEALSLVCESASVPEFTLDPANQPRACGQAAVPVVPFINFFNPAFRFPRNLKVSFGVDRQLPGGMSAAVDLLMTRGLNDFDLRDANLLPATSTATGEGGRVMYGRIDAALGIATPSRRSQEFGPVLEVRNDRGDRALAVTLQLGKRFAGRTELGVSYSHIESRDRFSASEDAADANIGFVPVDGALDGRRLATSTWNVPHKIGATGLFQLPDGFRLAVFYTGNSGAPYTYVVRGDANADGFGDPFDGRNFFNDPVYVPSSSADITLANPSDYSKLEQFIDTEPCLRESRGRISRRNRCRNPWVNILNVRLSKTFARNTSRSMELIADVFNLFALLGSGLGEIRETAGGPAVPLLELNGYDDGAGRGIYSLIPVERSEVANDISRWRIQLGARFNY